MGCRHCVAHSISEMGCRSAAPIQLALAQNRRGGERQAFRRLPSVTSGPAFRVTRSEIVARFAGSLLGFGWAVSGPAASARHLCDGVFVCPAGPRAEPVRNGYLVLIFTGLVPVSDEQRGFNERRPSVVANKAVLSNTVFPVDLVPIKAVLISQIKGTITSEDAAALARTTLRSWPGEGSLLVDDVVLLDSTGRDSGLRRGSPLTLRLHYRARQSRGIPGHLCRW